MRPSSLPPAFPATNDSERDLVRALQHGSVEAGKELIRRLETHGSRTQDLVNVCRRVSLLLPGDGWVLEKLYQATLADRNAAYARAIEHVLHAFDPKAAPVEPPPLSEQPEQPDRVQSMLFRETACRATEALGLVWAGAQHIFRRDPTSYGVTGLERVSPSGPTPLANLFGAASRLLGTTRTPVFQRRSGEPITINVALLAPPALIVTGEVRAPSATLSYHLGAMLGATMPEHALIYGAPEAQVRNVFKGLIAAFGPPAASREHLAAIATLAEMLWESIPARSQRRLRELCNNPEQIDYDLATAAARQAVRRSGLFTSGDLTIAVREACTDLGISARGSRRPRWPRVALRIEPGRRRPRSPRDEPRVRRGPLAAHQERRAALEPDLVYSVTAVGMVIPKPERRAARSRTSVSGPGDRTTSKRALFMGLARGALLPVVVTALTGCLDGTPEYVVPTRAPPVIITSQVLPSTMGLQRIDDTQPPLLPFDVPFRSEDAGEELAWFLVRDLNPAESRLNQVNIQNGTLPADPRPFDEQEERNFTFNWTWTVPDGLVGCHTVTFILGHASATSTRRSSHRDPARAPQVTWWFDFLEDGVDTVTSECPQPVLMGQQ